jgi:hypothetical protein
VLVPKRRLGLCDVLCIRLLSVRRCTLTEAMRDNLICSSSYPYPDSIDICSISFPVCHKQLSVSLCLSNVRACSMLYKLSIVFALFGSRVADKQDLFGEEVYCSLFPFGLPFKLSVSQMPVYGQCSSVECLCMRRFKSPLLRAATDITVLKRT